jgi:hypothetical protein
MRASELCNRVPPNVSVLMCDKWKFKSALRKYLNTHSFYSADEFFMREYVLLLLGKMFALPYVVKIVYIAKNLTCSKSYSLCNKIIDTSNVCNYVCVYVYVCMYCFYWACFIIKG